MSCETVRTSDGNILLSSSAEIIIVSPPRSLWTCHNGVCQIIGTVLCPGIVTCPVQGRIPPAPMATTDPRTLLQSSRPLSNETDPAHIVQVVGTYTNQRASHSLKYWYAWGAIAWQLSTQYHSPADNRERIWQGLGFQDQSVCSVQDMRMRMFPARVGDAILPWWCARDTCCLLSVLGKALQ